MSTDPTLKPDRTADWYMDVVWPLLPVPGEFDGMDACDQFRWRSVVRLAIEYVLCGERGVPPGSKTPHCPKGDGPCIRGCKGWECRDGWPDDPTLKPDIAALKKRLAEDPGFAAQVTGDRPLRRNVDGVCTRSTCECEREGLGDQCVWLKPAEAEFECLGEPSLCTNPRGCACFQAGRTDRPSTPVGWSDTDWLKHLEEIRRDQTVYHRGPLPETGWD